MRSRIKGTAFGFRGEASGGSFRGELVILYLSILDKAKRDENRETRNQVTVIFSFILDMSIRAVLTITNTADLSDVLYWQYPGPLAVV